MKIKRLPALVILLLLSQNLLYAETSKKLTNVDWLLMTPKEKGEQVLSSMKLLQDQGISLSRSPREYISEIDAVTDSPSLKPATIDNILTTIVFVGEPGSRTTMDNLKKKPEVKKIEMH